MVLGFFWHAANEMYVVAEALDPPAAHTQTAITDPSLALLVIGAGMFGGIGYWLIAGRSAGGWRPGKNATSPAP